MKRYKAVYKKHVGDDFPQDPTKQLMLAINAVFNSWNGNKAIEYRRIERITGLKGTAVNVQAMVFGNMGDDSGTGVAFTRDPNTGENVFYGDYLINAQGEDVVAGIRTPEPIAKLDERDAEGLRAAHGHPRRRWRSTTRRCRTSSSPCRTAPCTCSRPGPASGPAPRPSGSPSRWSRRS